MVSENNVLRTFYKFNFSIDDYKKYIEIEDDLMRKYVDSELYTSTSFISEEQQDVVDAITLVDDYSFMSNSMHGSYCENEVIEAINLIINYYTTTFEISSSGLNA